MGRWPALAARCLNRGGATLPSRLHNALFVLFLAGILAYGAGFAWYLLARFDLVNLISNTHDIVGIVIAGAVSLFAKADFTEPFRGAEAISVSTRTDDKWIKSVSDNEWTEAVYGGTQLMNRVLPENSVLGAWDMGGTIGYFSRFPVVNLDGLVNSYDYFHTRNADGAGITHLADIKRFERLPSILNGVELQLRPIGLPADENPADENTVARIWERVEPHFDHRSDSVGWIVDGRLAQAFVRNCAPNELIVLSGVGPGEETVVKAWTRTQTGLCVAALVLPRNALPTVRIETVPMGDYLARLAGNGPPPIRSDWDVYLVEDGLIYAKDSCSPEDAEPMFFVHLDPVDRNDLPGHRKQYGFDGFNFDLRNHLVDGRVCVARLDLPVRDYAIAAVRTGQFNGDGQIWKGGFDLAGPSGDGQAAP